MRIAYQPISHSATGIHFEPVQDGPYRARLKSVIRTQFDLISFVKTRGVQSGLMDTERPSSGLLGFRCFREDYSQFSFMQEKLRPCHN